MNLNEQIQALLDQAAATGEQVRVTWTLTKSAEAQTLSTPTPMTVILGADRIDALGGSDENTGSALEIRSGVGPDGPPALTLLAYRAGESGQEGPQVIRLQDWSRAETDLQHLTRRVRDLAAETRAQTAGTVALLDTIAGGGPLTPEQLRAFSEACQKETRGRAHPLGAEDDAPLKH